MDKRNRSYSLSVETPDGTTLVIEPPFTLEFDIQRNNLGSSNLASVRVYNLSENNRKKCYKDRFDLDLIKRLTLRAGYGDNMPIVFEGNVQQGWSVREGVNFITQMECYDVGAVWSNATTDTIFPKNTSTNEMLDGLITSMAPLGVSKGAIGRYSGSTPRGNSYSGSTCQILNQQSGGGFFIDNGKAYCLNDSECVQGSLEVIDANSGLLGTPMREETYLTFDMIFEPRLLVAQRIQLDSQTAQNFNGEYKITSIHHRGMISDAVCGDAITTVGLFLGSKSLTVVPG